MVYVHFCMFRTLEHGKPNVAKWYYDISIMDDLALNQKLNSFHVCKISLCFTQREYIFVCFGGVIFHEVKTITIRLNGILRGEYW